MINSSFRAYREPSTLANYYNIPHKRPPVKGFFEKSYPQAANKFSTSGMARAARRVPVVKEKVINKLSTKENGTPCWNRTN